MTHTSAAGTAADSEPAIAIGRRAALVPSPEIRARDENTVAENRRRRRHRRRGKRRRGGRYRERRPRGATTTTATTSSVGDVQRLAPGRRAAAAPAAPTDTRSRWRPVRDGEFRCPRRGPSCPRRCRRCKESLGLHSVPGLLRPLLCHARGIDARLSAGVEHAVAEIHGERGYCGDK